MTTETYVNYDRQPVSIWKKLNPIWWLKAGDTWTAPAANNGAPYLPGETRQWLRDFYWWWRNPASNLVGYVLGVEDNNYRVVGTAPVLVTTWRDLGLTGWKWSMIWPQHSIGTLFTAAAAGGVAMGSDGGALMWAALALFVGAFWKHFGPLPFISYANNWIEFYLGWRPASGGFGLKIVPGGPK